MKKELNLVHKKGIFYKNDFFNVKYIYSNNSKFAFIVRKKIGSAPVRNKIKRRIREVLKDQKNIKMHIIFFVKPEIIDISFIQLKEHIEKFISKCYK